MTFSLQNLTQLLDVSDSTLRVWMDLPEPLFVPDVPGGKGRNQGCRVGFMKALGLLVGVRVHRDTKHGCKLSYIGDITRAFANVDEKWLAQKLRERGHFFLMVHAGKPLLDGDLHGSRVNVQKALEDLHNFAHDKSD